MTNIQYTPRAVRFLPLRLPRICLVVTGRDANELIEKAESLARDNPFLEFRLDFLSQHRNRDRDVSPNLFVQAGFRQPFAE